MTSRDDVSPSGHWKTFALLLSLGIVVGLALLQSPGTGDRAQWLIYMDTARNHGILATYSMAAVPGAGVGHTDYPPLALILLGVFARFAKAVGMSDFIGLKLSLLLFLLVCAGIMTAWRGWLFGIATYLLLAIDALLLTYLDVYFLFTFLLGLWCLEQKKFAAGTALFTISFLTKWQPIILAPLILLYVMPRPFRMGSLVRLLVPSAGVFLVIFLIFGNSLITAFLGGTANPTFSGKALNLDWVITALSEVGDQLAQRGGAVLSINTSQLPSGIYRDLAVLSSVLRYICYAVAVADFYFSDRSITNFIKSAILCFMAYFAFGGGVHENHACLTAVLGLCWLAMDRSRYLEAVILAAMFNINIVVFYGFSGAGLPFPYVLGGWDITIFLAIFNLIVFAVLWLPAARQVLRHLLALLPQGSTPGGTRPASVPRDGNN